MRRHALLAIVIAVCISVNGLSAFAARPAGTAGVAGFFGFAALYLPALLTHTIITGSAKHSADSEKNKARQNFEKASEQLKESEQALKKTTAEIESIPCVKNNLDAFNNETVQVCEFDLEDIKDSPQMAEALKAKYQLEFVQAQNEETSYGVRQSRKVNCRRVKTGRQCGAGGCKDVYEIKCDTEYYMRTFLTVREKQGTALVGPGEQHQISCGGLNPVLFLLAVPHMLSSRKDVWSNEIRKTVEDWTTKFQYRYEIPGTVLASDLILDKRQSSDTVARQVVDFLTPLCAQTLQVANQHNETFYDELEVELMQLEEDQQLALERAANETHRARSYFDLSSQNFEERSRAYQTALAIHLPIFFIGSIVAGMASCWFNPCKF